MRSTEAAIKTTLVQFAARARRFASRQAPIAAGASPHQIYAGYRPEHEALLRSMAVREAELGADRFIDGFGQVTLFSCVPFSSAFDTGRLTMPIPDDGFHAEAPEYIAVADSVKRAGSRYCIAELGAAWGPWIGLGGVMASNRGVKAIELIGIEALPARFELLRRHLAVNSLRPEEGDETTLGAVTCRLMAGAATATRTEVWFPDVPVTDLGSAISGADSGRDYRGRRVRNLRVQGYPLAEILRDARVDLLHVDVQGAELELVRANLDLLARQVSAMMIATHSRVIEGELIALLYENGWQLELEKPCRVAWRPKPPSQEAMTELDGCQYWRRAG
jgi:Methyltransferase FkbM domain